MTCTCKWCEGETLVDQACDHDVGLVTQCGLCIDCGRKRPAYPVRSTRRKLADLAQEAVEEALRRDHKTQEEKRLAECKANIAKTRSRLANKVLEAARNKETHLRLMALIRGCLSDGQISCPQCLSFKDYLETAEGLSASLGQDKGDFYLDVSWG